ncbi:NAD(P)-dependent oxidoreductase [Planotetraspora phitsanulokensis]|uniref:Tartronate semialdehyde reductase n=1 Tax=Planotetraspora phitsanulokensis TaxID=575192 RepID=A0A8J3U7Q6_9ACTN|nr:NAD(P)-dependent oxidoreductase [Planotetraspora phitsanulokensis]GII39865.1 tartronate semialdehyde reductase [Planotetraspora phitsanulokensis]
MRIAVLGMGRMGRALAQRLLSQHFRVTVWNRTPGQAGQVVQDGATEAFSPAEAAHGADAVLLSLSDDTAVRDVTARLVDTMPDGDEMFVADTSTVSPGTSRALRELVPLRRFVAAPILGGPLDLVLGNARVLLGGDRATADRLEPIWRDVFASSAYCGEDPGCAVTLKLLNNYLLMANVVLVSEVVTTAEAAGFDMAAVRDQLFTWATVPPILRNRLDDIVGGAHEGWFTTRLGAKDVRLAREVSEQHGVMLPLAHLVERLYEEAAELGWAEADIAAVVELVRRERR